MRKLSLPLILGSTLALGACATNPYGGYGSPYGSQGGLDAVLGAVLGAAGSGGYGSQGYGGYGGYGAQSFQQAAVQACGSTAARYGGRVAIRDVRQSSRSTLRVYGLVGTRYGTRDFACSFRSDGRITDFDI